MKFGIIKITSTPTESIATESNDSTKTAKIKVSQQIIIYSSHENSLKFISIPYTITNFG